MVKDSNFARLDARPSDKGRGKSHRLHCCCDKAACAYFVSAICRTDSNQFEFVPQIGATKFCRSDVWQRFVASCVLTLIVNQALAGMSSLYNYWQIS